MPNTSSAARNPVMPAPVATTVPAASSSGTGLFGREPKTQQPHEVGLARHQMPGAPVHRGCPYLHEDLVRRDGGVATCSSRSTSSGLVP